MSEFKDRLESLPLELYKMIYKETFEADATTVVIDKDYKPPLLLQVSRKTRKVYQKSYYKRTTFVIEEPEFFFRWLSSLKRPVIYMVRDIHYSVQDGFIEIWPEDSAENERWHFRISGMKYLIRQVLLGQMHKRRVSLQKRALKLNVQLPGMKEITWTPSLLRLCDEWYAYKNKIAG